MLANKFIMASFTKLPTLDFIARYDFVNPAGSIVMPAGIEANDLLFVCQVAGAQKSVPYSNVTYPDAFPLYGTGFTGHTYATYTQAYNTSGGYITYRSTTATSHKLATGTESGATIGGFISDTYVYGTSIVLFHFRPSKAIIGVQVAIAGNTGGWKDPYGTYDPPAYTLSTSSSRIEIPFFAIGELSSKIISYSASPQPVLSETSFAVSGASVSAGAWISTRTSSSYTVNAGPSSYITTLLIGKLVLTL